jgi:hypothetical protein
VAVMVISACAADSHFERPLWVISCRNNSGPDSTRAAMMRGKSETPSQTESGDRKTAALQTLEPVSVLSNRVSANKIGISKNTDRRLALKKRRTL